jgi:hypothetical protein
VLQRNLPKEAQNKHGQLCRGSECDSSVTQYKGTLQERKQTWAAAEDQSADSSATQCTAKNAATKHKTWAAVPEDQSADSAANSALQRRCKSAQQRWQLCQRDQGADSSATQSHCRNAARARNKHGQLSGSGVLTPLQHSALQRALQKRRTWAAVSEDQVLTSATQCTLKNAARKRKANMGSCVRGSGADSPVTQCTAKERCKSANKHEVLCQRIRALTSATQCTARRCNERTTTMAAVSEDQVLTPL